MTHGYFAKIHIGLLDDGLTTAERAMEQEKKFKDAFVKIVGQSINLESNALILGLLNEGMALEKPSDALDQEMAKLVDLELAKLVKPGIGITLGSGKKLLGCSPSGKFWDHGRVRELHIEGTHWDCSAVAKEYDNPAALDAKTLSSLENMPIVVTYHYRSLPA